MLETLTQKEDKQKMNLVFSVPTFFAIAIFTVCYTKIYRAVRKNSKDLNGKSHAKESSKKVTLSKQGKEEEGEPQLEQHKRREAILMKVAISKVSVFVVCWLPLAVCSCLVAAKYHYAYEKEIRTSFFVFSFFNAFWNPIVYYTNVRKGN